MHWVGGWKRPFPSKRGEKVPANASLWGVKLVVVGEGDQMVVVVAVAAEEEQGVE